MLAASTIMHLPCLYVFPQNKKKCPNQTTLDSCADWFLLTFRVPRRYIFAFVSLLRAQVWRYLFPRFISFAVHVSVINVPSIQLFIQVFLVSLATLLSFIPSCLIMYSLLLLVWLFSLYLFLLSLCPFSVSNHVSIPFSDLCVGLSI